MKKTVVLMVMLLLALAAMGAVCGGSSKDEDVKLTNQSSVSGTKNEPAWLNRPASLLKDETGVAFYGVGNSAGITNPSLKLERCDNRARQDLGKVLDTYVASFMKDFISSASSSDMKQADEQQFVSSIQKTISDTNLIGSQIQQRWTGPDGTLYCLAKLSFDDMGNGVKKEVAKKSKELKMTADEAVKELDAELQKRKASVPNAE